MLTHTPKLHHTHWSHPNCTTPTQTALLRYAERLRRLDSRTSTLPPFNRFDNGVGIPDLLRPWLAEQPQERIYAFGNPFATSPATNPNATEMLFDVLTDSACPPGELYFPLVVKIMTATRPKVNEVRAAGSGVRAVGSGARMQARGPPHGGRLNEERRAGEKVGF